MNRADFQQLADLRIAEAIALLALPTPMPDGAYYLGGYAVECALKACIAKLVKEFDFPDKKQVQDSHTHNIDVLIRLAGLEKDQTADANANVVLSDNWEKVGDWNEQARYQRYSLADAQALIDAITDPTNGVLTWIKARW